MREKERRRQLHNTNTHTQTGLSWYVLCLGQEAENRLTGSSKGRGSDIMSVCVRGFSTR